MLNIIGNHNVCYIKLEDDLYCRVINVQPSLLRSYATIHKISNDSAFRRILIELRIQPLEGLHYYLKKNGILMTIGEVVEKVL